MVADGTIRPEKAIFPNRCATTNDDVRADEAVASDSGVVPDVIAAPNDNVFADRHEGLNSVCLKDKTVFAAMG